MKSEFNYNFFPAAILTRLNELFAFHETGMLMLRIVKSISFQHLLLLLRLRFFSSPHHRENESEERHWSEE